MDYLARQILLPTGWKDNVLLSIDAEGNISDIVENANSSSASVIDGFVIPGMPNLHSHAFQRAMAGLSEYSVAGENNFWSWRETMYRLANELSPEEMEIIAAQLYLEMLKAGYTSVAEFHYLHHDRGGKPYAQKQESSARLIEAAKSTGIGMTLLPVLYMCADMSGAPASPQQARFVHDIDGYVELFESLAQQENVELNIGMAMHSLRAVSADALLTIVDYCTRSFAAHPMHIHVAEQEREVEECLATHAQRPVQWLFNHVDINETWCLVHATHVNPDELHSMASSDCVVGLCPSTEANLGDGIFPLGQYSATGGCFGIGSDSHASVSPVEELRWLEYAQRLLMHERNVSSTDNNPHCGWQLWNQALKGGARACGRNIGSIEAGKRADLLVLDDQNPMLHAKQAEYALDSLVFSGNQGLVRDVMVGGKWRVKERVHEKEESITPAFNKLMQELLKRIH